MPPERQMPGSPDDWLRRARSDLALAKVPLPEGALYEDLCFHAQQAAEKAIKAVYRTYKHARGSKPVFPRRSPQRGAGSVCKSMMPSACGICSMPDAKHCSSHAAAIGGVI